MIMHAISAWRGSIIAFFKMQLFRAVVVRIVKSAPEASKAVSMASTLAAPGGCRQSAKRYTKEDHIE
jgi:hypothetical protein